MASFFVSLALATVGCFTGRFSTTRNGRMRPFAFLASALSLGALLLYMFVWVPRDASTYSTSGIAVGIGVAWVAFMAIVERRVAVSDWVFGAFMVALGVVPLIVLGLL